MLGIIQVLNNNCAIVDLGQGRQALVKGRGVAYQKRKGDSLDPERIEKVMYLATKESQQNLAFLLKDIPINIVTTTYEIVDNAKSKYHYQVADFVYVTLADHINGMYKHLQSNTYQKTPVPDMQEQYPTEYQIAAEGLRIINSNLKVYFPKDEIKSIALHFINGRSEGDDDDAVSENESSQLTTDLNDLVQSILQKNMVLRNGSNQNFYDRLMIHLGYLADRLARHEPANERAIIKIEEEMRQSYPHSYEIAHEIYSAICQELDADLGINEELYLLIHIQRIIDEKEHESDLKAERY
ncbi:transcriptional antiterminator [Ligilactobacillus salitolerans]|uniref:Transcriptional antiterminator n=1 Tax=Ligilactobacillus salitolerans TaxID=1808352 RepID=A0A401IQN0_9LACO|nr:PRD domain-containing protein [Ligilactobacillus salitolerans]GBG93815.1 transcriptional antiterminator [Ligilactobacillus salitolerans]